MVKRPPCKGKVDTYGIGIGKGDGNCYIADDFGGLSNSDSGESHRKRCGS